MKIDFCILETYNPNTIVFVDESNYGDTSPIFPTLQVRFPNLEKVYKVLIKPDKVNTFYSTHLGWSSAITEFPDGIYEFKYSIEPHNTLFKCKKVMKVDRAYSDLKKINNMLSCKDEKYFSKLAEIHLLLVSAQLDVDTNAIEANNKLELAKKLITKLSC